ncbi:hypothetical protein ACERIM_12295 [Natrinema sp. H-ect1]|uniref:hypothetical protein n=1 Tax=Natrinema sp. H-ect1 TaxID=3242700 RepID=UPI00359CF9CE
MTARVFYHHPENKQFSFDFVNPDLEAIGERVLNYESHKSVKVEQYELDQTVYVVYTSSGATGDADAIEYDLVDQISSMASANRVIATRYVGLFKEVLRGNYEEEGKRVQAYKDIAAEDIEPALNQIDWDGSATEVAGRLASNLILKHALPNANHRTAIGMIQVYLRRIEPDFSMPDTARQTDADDEYAWMDWVNEYIKESKRLLTVRRKGDRFRYLSQFGCEVIERKHGIEIELNEYELSLPASERWRQYAEQHEELWVEFVRNAVQRSGYEELIETKGLTKHEFAEQLEKMK